MKKLLVGIGIFATLSTNICSATEFLTAEELGLYDDKDIYVSNIVPEWANILTSRRTGDAINWRWFMLRHDLCTKNPYCKIYKGMSGTLEAYK